MSVKTESSEDTPSVEPPKPVELYPRLRLGRRIYNDKRIWIYWPATIEGDKITYDESKWTYGARVDKELARYGLKEKEEILTALELMEEINIHKGFYGLLEEHRHYLRGPREADLGDFGNFCRDAWEIYISQDCRRPFVSSELERKQAYMTNPNPIIHDYPEDWLEDTVSDKCQPPPRSGKEELLEDLEAAYAAKMKRIQDWRANRLATLEKSHGDQGQTAGPSTTTDAQKSPSNQTKSNGQFNDMVGEPLPTVFADLHRALHGPFPLFSSEQDRRSQAIEAAKRASQWPWDSIRLSLFAAKPATPPAQLRETTMNKEGPQYSGTATSCVWTVHEIYKSERLSK